MIDRALPYGLDRGFQFVAPTETDEKIIAPFIPRNPLKSLDSDERIQGHSSFRLFW